MFCMKRLIGIILIFFVFVTGCAKKPEKNALEKIIERDMLIVGVKTDTKPLGFIDPKTGRNAGYDIDIAKYVAKDILGSEYKIKYVSVTPGSKIEAITSGEVDMVIAAMTVTPQRQYFIDFSEPYYFAGQTALVKEDSQIRSFTDLKKKTTIVLLSSTAEDNIRKIIPAAKIIGYKTYKEAFDAFINGKADAISTDDVILSGFLAENKGYRMLRTKISQEPYAIAIKQYDDKVLKKRLDAVVLSMKRDGTINRLNEKWKLKHYNVRENDDKPEDVELSE